VDDLYWMIYADWLEDQGDPLANFIREDLSSDEYHWYHWYHANIFERISNKPATPSAVGAGYDRAIIYSGVGPVKWQTNLGVGGIGVGNVGCD
jgi:hypothetical protein